MDIFTVQSPGKNESNENKEQDANYINELLMQNNEDMANNVEPKNNSKKK